MNSLIRKIGEAIARQIESGSSRGAMIGMVIGVLLLGGLALFGWSSGTTGYMGLGLTIAGTLLGAILGGLIGSAIGPEDSQGESDRREAIKVTDYNRKLIALVPLVGGIVMALAMARVYYKNPSDEEAQVMIGIILFGILLAMGSLIYLSVQNLSITLGDDIRINRLLNRTRYEYSTVIQFKLLVPGDARPPYPEGMQLTFLMELPGRLVSIPISHDKANELRAFLERRL